MVRILVGTPLASKNSVHEDFRVCYENAIITCARNKIEVVSSVMVGSLLPSNRIRLCDKAIERECDYVVMMDSDMVFDAEAIVRLIGHNKDVISGLYFKKQPPYEPLAYMRSSKGEYSHIDNIEKGGLLDVDAVGAGLLVIKTSILKDMPKPWFACPPLFLTYDKKSGFALKKKGIKNLCLGEDMWFCYLAKQSGFDVVVDLDTKCYHIGDFHFGLSEYLQCRS